MSLTKVSYSMIKGSPINVLDYGADPTGVNECSSEIQAAINAGNSIFIPSGTYKINTTLLIPAYKRIYGEGRTTTIDSKVSVGNAAVQLGTDPDVVSYYCGVENLQIIPAANTKGIVLYGCVNAYICNVLINAYPHTAITGFEVDGANVSAYFNTFINCNANHCHIGYNHTSTGTVWPTAQTYINCQVLGDYPTDASSIGWNFTIHSSGATNGATTQIFGGNAEHCNIAVAFVAPTDPKYNVSHFPSRIYIYGLRTEANNYDLYGDQYSLYNTWLAMYAPNIGGTLPPYSQTGSQLKVTQENGDTPAYILTNASTAIFAGDSGAQNSIQIDPVTKTISVVAGNLQKIQIVDDGGAGTYPTAKFNRTGNGTVATFGRVDGGGKYAAIYSTNASVFYTESTVNDIYEITPSAHTHKFYCNGYNTGLQLTVSSTGVAVVGALSKGSGSFKIDHPLKPETHHLVHSFIEGPQADLIYRGKATLVNGKITVNIDESAGMTEGTFVSLCREVQCFTSNESGWTVVKGQVNGNILTIEAQNNDCNDTISWMVIGERQDRHMYETDWTDDNGKVIVEPKKIDVLSN